MFQLCDSAAYIKVKMSPFCRETSGTRNASSTQNAATMAAMASWNSRLRTKLWREALRGAMSEISEEAARAHEHHREIGRIDADGLHRRRKQRRRDGFDEADDEPCRQRPEDRAETAERHRHIGDQREG